MHIRRRNLTGLPATHLGVRDAMDEAIAGMVQRPGRATLTMLGTILGVGAFVAVLGLTSTAASQISQQFTILQATTVTVTDQAAVDQMSTTANTSAATVTHPGMSFPDDADERVGLLNGVVAAGVWWQVPLGEARITSVPGRSISEGAGLKAYAATPGAVAAMEPKIVHGVGFDSFIQRDRQHVALLSSVAAGRLHVSRLDSRPAIFIDDTPYTVIGIFESVQRATDTALGFIIPASTALQEYGNPDPSTMPATMLIHTRLGAARLIADQAPTALRPDAPQRLVSAAPPDPHTLRDKVTNDLTGLFLALAAICLVIGAVGIANTTLVAVLERTVEIGLRRAMGARPRHIAGQFLTESLALGTIGGIIGTGCGVLTVIGVAVANQWTAVLHPSVTVAAPLLGSLVGLIAGTYPALRAARTSPLLALRAE